MAALSLRYNLVCVHDIPRYARGRNVFPPIDTTRKMNVYDPGRDVGALEVVLFDRPRSIISQKLLSLHSPITMYIERLTLTRLSFLSLHFHRRLCNSALGRIPKNCGSASRIPDA